MNFEYPIPELPDDCIVVLPGAVDGDTGIYPNETTTLVKELRADGIPAAYLHDADHRQWQVHMGEMPIDLIIGIAESVVGSAIFAAFSAHIGERFGTRRTTIHLVNQRKTSKGARASTTVDITGTGPELQSLLETALQDHDDDPT